MAATPTATSSTKPSDVELEIVAPPSDPALDELTATHPAYVSLCQRAAEIKSTTGFGDIEAMDVVRRSGQDLEGRPVMLFIPGNLERAPRATVRAVPAAYINLPAS